MSSFRKIPLRNKVVLHKEIESLLSPLLRKKIPIYFYGRSVIDILLNRYPYRYYLIFGEDPKELLKAFPHASIHGKKRKYLHIQYNHILLDIFLLRSFYRKEDLFTALYKEAHTKFFNIESLYFSPYEREVWDFTGSYEEYKKGTLRLLKEAPISSLLYAYFLSSLYQIPFDHSTQSWIKKQKKALKKERRENIYKEFSRFFLLPIFSSSIKTLIEEGIFPILFPRLWKAWKKIFPSISQNFLFTPIGRYLQHIEKNFPRDPALIYASFFWHLLQRKKIPLKKEDISSFLSPYIEEMALPSSIEERILYIYLLQPLLEKEAESRADPHIRSLEKERYFPEALSFFLIRAREEELTMALFWEIALAPPLKNSLHTLYKR